MISSQPTRGERRGRPLPRRRGPTVAGLALTLVLAVGLTLASSACSSSGSSTDDAASTTSSSTTGTSPGGTGSTLATIPSGTATVDVGATDLGRVLVDLTGHTLYVFTADASGTPTCVDEACTKVWPPLTGSAIAVGSGVPAQPGEFKLVPRPDGSSQLTVNGQPLYTYSGDAGPGQTNGQGVAGTWFVVGTDGRAITT